MAHATGPAKMNNKWMTCTLAVGIVFGAAGCGGEDTTVGSDVSNVTDVQLTDIKTQTLGTCWLYTTVGWAESMHLRYTGARLDLSEAYLTYWHWFEQIAGRVPFPFNIVYALEEGLVEGGFWSYGAELISRYGVMHEGSFLPDESDTQRAARKRNAARFIEESLEDGVLASKDNRDNPALVAHELALAWGLDGAVVDELAAVFGSDVSRTLADGPPPSNSAIVSANAVAVGHETDGTTITLADAVGTASALGAHLRSGKYAWDSHLPPLTSWGRRGYEIDIQTALHAHQPIPISWLVDWGARDQSAFREPSGEAGNWGGHATILADYQVNVPGLGTLEAGTWVQDGNVLESALSRDAKIEFFRVKNSWGMTTPPDDDGVLYGYFDLYADYLYGEISICASEDCTKSHGWTPLRGVVLPPADFLEVASDTCQQGVYESNCSGAILHTCYEGTVFSYDCEAKFGQTCGYSQAKAKTTCVP